MPQEEGPKRPLDPDQVVGLCTIEPVSTQHTIWVALDDEFEHAIRPWRVSETVAAPDSLSEDVNILAGQKTHRRGWWSFEDHPDNIQCQPVDRYDPTWNRPNFQTRQSIKGLDIQHHITRRRSAAGKHQPLARLLLSQALFDPQGLCRTRYDRRFAYPAAPRSTAILERNASIARGVQYGDGWVCHKSAAGIESYGRHVRAADSQL